MRRSNDNIAILLDSILRVSNQPEVLLLIARTTKNIPAAPEHWARLLSAMFGFVSWLGLPSVAEAQWLLLVSPEICLHGHLHNTNFQTSPSREVPTDPATIRS